MKIKKWKDEMQIISKVFGSEEEKYITKRYNKINYRVPDKPIKLTVENLGRHDKAEESKHKVIQPIKEDKPAEVPVQEEAKAEAIPSPAKSEQKAAEPVPASARSEKAAKSDRKKPAWALTEKQAEELKEQEVDNLLEFAYQLDYEKFIEDFEVRQAISVLKERVQELKKDDKWKENFAEKWNENAIAAPKEEDAKPEENGGAKVEADEKVETRSMKSGPKSIRSQAKSIKSLADTVKEMNDKQKEGKADWDKSVKGAEKLTVEDKAAIQIADQVLQNAPHLKGIHSKTSIRKILEREAKAQLMSKEPPKIVTVKSYERCGNLDPSNLPYLHRNEAV